MVVKTQGIVLKTIKYQENHLIANVYTLAEGQKSFLIRGYFSTRARRRHSYFQPLSVIDLVFFQKENQSLHKVNESRVAYLHQSIQSDPVKLSLGLTIVEVFYDTVKEENPNHELFHFLKEIILSLDQSEKNLVHIFIYFLVRLSAYLGFLPLDNSDASPKVWLDIPHGRILPAKEKPSQAAFVIRQFLQTDLNGAQQIYFERNVKREMIRSLFEYYRHHVTGFKYPQTLKVFAEIFQ